MIVKYYKDGVWGYIDNVRQAANKEIEPLELIKQYDGRDLDGPIKEGEDPVCYMNGELLPDGIIMSNKAFVMATVEQEEWGHNVHCENLLGLQGLYDNLPAATILLYVEDHKEYDTIVLVTNQKVYLMNDKGQTIERLV